MDVGPGGKQPSLRDTVWNGQVQRMVLEDGRPEGKRMKIVLQERSVDTTEIRANQIVFLSAESNPRRI